MSDFDQEPLLEVTEAIVEMERNDLIRENGPIFVGQGKALTRGASDMRVLVVGNLVAAHALAQVQLVDLVHGDQLAQGVIDRRQRGVGHAP